jgi:DNA-binding CsgD family transcriptional regulator
MSPEHAKRATVPTARAAADRRRRVRRVNDGVRLVLESISAWLADGESDALFFLDESANVLLMNVGATYLLSDTSVMRMARSRVSLSDPKCQAVFEGVLLGHKHPFDCRRMFEAPIRATMEAIPCAAGPIHVLRISGPTGDRRVAATLRAAFGLTAAEAQIALGIYRGMSLVRIAGERSASINTVKTQARSVFQKCGISSSAALVRRICEILTSHPRIASLKNKESDHAHFPGAVSRSGSSPVTRLDSPRACGSEAKNSSYRLS